MKKRLTIIAILFFYKVFSQSIITTASDEIKNDYGSINYTIGQTFFKTYKNNSTQITEGVQQPYEITNTLHIYAEQLGEIEMVFPNPVAHKLTINIKKHDEQTHYSLYNVQGKVIKMGKINNTVTPIYVQHLKKGVYFLKITYKKQVKEYKIIKN